MGATSNESLLSSEVQMLDSEDIWRREQRIEELVNS